MRRALWLIGAFMCGAISMGLEIAAARLFAPAVGSSLHVWATLISAVMAAMAIGYVIGGRVADRASGDRWLFASILGAGVYQAGALFAARPVLAVASRLSDFFGTALAACVLFAVPVALLAGVAPQVIKLSMREGVGAAAGRVYGLATAGSIAGVLVTSFGLLPVFGTRACLQLLAGVSIALGVAGLLRARASAALPAAIVAIAAGIAVALAPERELSPSAVWSGESLYHTVQVVELGPVRGLVLDQPSALHSAVGAGGYWEELALGSTLARGRDVLVLGMGAGASIKATWSIDQEADIDAVEIDPLVVQVADQHFGIRAGRQLHISIEDARRFLARTQRRYDVIQSDLFRGGPDIPPHVATAEFFALVRDHLRDTGVFTLNVFDPAPEHTLLCTIAATLKTAFPVLLHQPQTPNHLLYAFKTQPAPTTGLKKLIPLSCPLDQYSILTDDRAPLESLTRRAMKSAQLGGALPR